MQIRDASTFTCPSVSSGGAGALMRRMMALFSAGYGLTVATVTPGLAQEMPGASVTRTPAEIVQAASGVEWRALDPESTIYLELPDGRVVLELAPLFAPQHVENIRLLVRAGYFDGGAIVRSQDNYVVQWATRSVADGEPTPALLSSSLAAEFEASAAGHPFTALPDPDVYARETGFVSGFPVGRDPTAGLMWMVHCYGMVGVARGNDPDSGNGTQLYAVTGHAPRHLDRNITMVGRVVDGMEHLSTAPRGTGALGFYESPEEVIPIRSARVAIDLPVEARVRLEVLRTDSGAFRELIMARRSRIEDFFVRRADRVDVCNVGIPTRTVTP